MQARREPSLRIMRHSLRLPPSRCETPPPGRAPSYLRPLSSSPLILFLQVVAGHDFQPPNVTRGSYGSLRVQPIIPRWRKEPFDDPDWLFDFKYDGSAISSQAAEDEIGAGPADDARQCGDGA